MDEDYTFLKLQCSKCECVPEQCNLYPWALYPREKQGCTRKVTENDKAKFTHYMEEVLPFISTYKNKQTALDTLNQIYDFCQYIYQQPFGVKIDKRGKAIIAC